MRAAPALAVLAVLGLGAQASLPLAAAEDGAGPGPLTARRAGWQGGDAAATRLLQLQHLGEAGAFELRAADLRVRAVSSDTYAKAPGSAAYSGPLWTSEESDHRGVALASAQGRAGGFVFVVPQPAPAPSASAAAMPSAPSAAVGCGRDAVAAGDGVTRQVPSQVESPNPNPVLDLSDALAVTPCGRVEVCGALTVVLWERDASGSSAQGPLDLRSGQLERPGKPDLRPALGRAQQLYLSTPDGCLSMEPADATLLLVEGLDLAGARAMALAGAAGPVGRVQVPADSSVDLAGSLRAGLRRSGDRVLVEALAGVESARLDGEPVDVAATTGGPGLPGLSGLRGAGGWALAGLPVALAAVAAAALWLRRRARSTGRMLDRMYGAADREDAARVRALASRVLERDTGQYEAWAARAVANLDLQRFDDSLADCRRALELLGFRSPAQRAALEIVACRASSLKGDTDGAVKWLGEAYVNDLPSAQSAMQFPEVRRLLNTPGYS